MKLRPNARHLAALSVALISFTMVQSAEAGGAMAVPIDWYAPPRGMDPPLYHTSQGVILENPFTLTVDTQPGSYLVLSQLPGLAGVAPWNNIVEAQFTVKWDEATQSSYISDGSGNFRAPDNGLPLRLEFAGAPGGVRQGVAFVYDNGAQSPISGPQIPVGDFVVSAAKIVSDPKPYNKDNLYAWGGNVDLQLPCYGDCASCRGGPSLESIHYTVPMGHTSYGQVAQALYVRANNASELTNSPKDVVPTVGMEVRDKTDAQGKIVIRQIRGAEAIAICLAVNGGYSVALYDIGAITGLDANNLYTVVGPPFKTVAFSDTTDTTVVGAPQQRRFVEEENGASKATNFTNDDQGVWNMSAAGGERNETLTSTLTGATENDLQKTETRQVKDSGGTIIATTVAVYRLVLGTWQPVSITRGTGAEALTETMGYYDDSTDSASFGRIKHRVDPYGHWEIYSYDREGRLSRVVSQVGDNGMDSSEAENHVRIIIHRRAKPALTEIELHQGVEIARHYVVLKGLNREERDDIEDAKPGAAWDDPSNLVTITKFGPGRSGYPEPVSVRRPDGTMTLTSYTHDAAQRLTIVVAEGEPNATGTEIVNGTRTTNILNLAGQEIEHREVGIVNGSTTENSVELILDHYTRAFLRPDGSASSTQMGTTKAVVNHDDTTSETTELGCCGPLRQTDRLGTVTSYTYDDAGRLSTETRAGITLATVYDAEGRLVATTRTGTDGSAIVLSTAHYDSAGRLTETTTPPVNDAPAPARSTTSYAETTVGAHRVRTTTLPDGVRVETYYQDGRLLSTTGSAVHPVQYEYGATSLSQGGVNVPCTWTKEIKLNAAGQLTMEWTTTYLDGRGRTLRVESPREVTIGGVSREEWYYYGQGTVAGSVGRLAKKVDPDGVTMLYSYNAQGETELTALDMNGNGTIDLAGPDRVRRTAHTYGTRGNVVVDRTTTSVYQAAGAATPTETSVQETSPDGRFAWSTRYGLETTMTSTWTGSGATTTVTTLPDLSSVTEVRADGRLGSTTRKAADGTVLFQQSMGYDPHGRLQTSTDVRNGPTDYTSYTDDRLHTLTTPAADAQTARQTTTYVYGANGQKATETLPDNAVVNYTYWPTGELRREWGARVYPVEYGWDAQGRTATLTTWQDFAGQTGAAVTTWNYDAASGRLLSKKYADNKGPSYSYTASGRLLTRTWERGIVTTYAYDPNSGDPSGTTYSDATPAVGILRDRGGRPWQISDAAGTRLLTYTPDGQLDLEDFGQAGMFAAVKIDPGYDALHRRTSLNASAGATSLLAVSYTPDSASRLGSVTSGNDSATYTYEPLAGNLVQKIDFAHDGLVGVTTTKRHDKLIRLTNIETATGVGARSTLVNSFSYAYDAANQRTRATIEDNSYWAYAYDTLGQVINGSKHLSDDIPALGRQFGYSFDDIGNRKIKANNGRTGAYTPNLLNQHQTRQIPAAIDVYGEAVADATITVNAQPTARQGRAFYKALPVDNSMTDFTEEVKVSGVKSNAGPTGEDVIATSFRHFYLPKTPQQFSYDDNGNLIDDSQWIYTWDAEGQLVGMESHRSAAPRVQRKLVFKYDYLHRRIEKAVFESDLSGSYGSQPTFVRRFLYDGWNLIWEQDGYGQAVRSYVWGLDVNGSSGETAGVGALLFANQKAEEQSAAVGMHVITYDGNGNVVLAARAENYEVDARFEYGPFGEIISRSGNFAFALPITFSTKYRDGESGLSCYTLRFYDGSSGRWLSRDRLEEGGGLNVYAICNNQVLSNVDVLGLGARLPFFDPQDPCCDWVENLKIMARIIRRRHAEMLRDVFGQFGSDEARPTTQGGRGTWQTHQDTYRNEQKFLARKLQEYRDRGCGDPIPVYVYIWATKPAPSAPTRGVTFKDWLLLNIPGSDASWTTFGNASGAVGVGALIVATGGAAAPYVAAAAEAAEVAAGAGALATAAAR